MSSKSLIPACEAGWQVSVLKHELLPVPLSVAETDGVLHTENKSVLAYERTAAIYCPYDTSYR